jgi:inner membrane protein
VLLVSDQRGVRALEGSGLRFASDSQGSDGFAMLAAPLPQQFMPADQQGKPFSLALKLNMHGSERLSVVPVGAVSKVQFKSAFTNPSFDGPFAADHKTGPNGFTANWQVLALNRGFGSYFQDGLPFHQLQSSAFGTSFVVPASHYQRAERSVKYGFLFICLSFAGYFLFELLTRTRIHPVQYGIIGAGLTLFYLLLLALSEKLGFNWAYTVAAGVLTLMIGGYSKAILRSTRLGLSAAAMLGVIYAALYVLVALEEQSLLLGSVLLVGTLGLVMYLTRQIDWYAGTDNKPGESKSGNIPAFAPDPH